MRPRATATARPASSSGRGAREPTFFASPEAWRRWLERHHASAGELLVGFHKGGARRAGLRRALAVDPPMGADAMAGALRTGEPAVVGRIAEGRLLLDMMTVSDDELPLLAAALKTSLG